MIVQGLVSVVVPTWNYGRFLPQALQSALKQTGVDLEVVVVDDGSTDNTPEVLAHHAREDHRVRVLRQANQGLSRARNAGLALSRGEFVVFLDADDLLLPGALASQQHLLRQEARCGLAVGRSVFFETLDAGGDPIPCGQWRLFRADLVVHLHHFNIAPPHAFMSRRALLDDLATVFDPRMRACEDHDLWFRLVQTSGTEVIRNDHVAAAYRRHPDSMSRRLDRQWTHDAFMHLRVGSALLAQVSPLRSSDPTGFVGREHGLAAAAGCLRTAGRLAASRPQAAARLRRLALDIAAVLPGMPPSALPETRDYFLTRLALSLAWGCAAGESWPDGLRPLLHRVAPGRLESLLALGPIMLEARSRESMARLCRQP